MAHANRVDSTQHQVHRGRAFGRLARAVLMREACQYEVYRMQSNTQTHQCSTILMTMSSLQSKPWGYMTSMQSRAQPNTDVV